MKDYVDDHGNDQGLGHRRSHSQHILKTTTREHLQIEAHRPKYINGNVAPLHLGMATANEEDEVYRISTAMIVLIDHVKMTMDIVRVHAETTIDTLAGGRTRTDIRVDGKMIATDPRANEIHTTTTADWEVDLTTNPSLL